MSDERQETALDALFRPVADTRKLLLAVSGGPDSMALLHLARDWAASMGRVAIEAATVDHGLRPEAAAESRQVGLWCKSLGIPHHELVWDGEKPRTRLQERARDARYELLFALARDIGAEAVLTAHHADDQAETILFRLLRGSGIAGLAGMAPVTWRGSLRLVRPLLTMTKRELVTLCHDRHQAYVEDPSNLDPKFARVRMRRLLELLAGEGLDPADLARLAARAARTEQALASTAAVLFAGLPTQRTPERVSCDLTALRDQPEEFLLRFLAEETGRLAGAAPRLERVERLALRLHEALHQSRPIKSTLGGLVISLSSGGLLTLAPEPPRERGRSNLLHVTV